MTLSVSTALDYDISNYWQLAWLPASTKVEAAFFKDCCLQIWKSISRLASTVLLYASVCVVKSNFVLLVRPTKQNPGLYLLHEPQDRLLNLHFQVTVMRKRGKVNQHVKKSVTVDHHFPVGLSACQPY